MKAPYRELLIGCGHRRDKLIALPGENLEWKNLYTLDLYQICKPDIICDLDVLGRWDPHTTSARPGVYEMFNDNWTFRDNVFDEIHAYEVLEHLGWQGDADAFFSHFAEIWRILKPNGHLFATVPSRFSPWAWGDPSHRRLIQPESLVFLNQMQYKLQLDGPRRTPMSDFRNIYKADFDIVASTDNHVLHTFCLKAIKPSRGNP